jgi:xylulokinase
VVTGLTELGETGYYVWSYMVPGHWMIDCNTRACADSTVWLKDVFYKNALSSKDAYEQIGQEAGNVCVGADGLFFHPYLLGEDAPYWQSYLRGSFFGLTKAHGRPHCARAVLEGTGFSLRDARSVLGKLVDGFQEYVLIGGGTRNAVWLQIVVDILGVDSKVSVDADSAFGAAMLAGVASGVYTGLNQAVEICSHINHVVQQNVENHKIYDRLFEKYKQIKQILDTAY